MEPFRWAAHAVKKLTEREIPRVEAEKSVADLELVVPPSSSRQFFTRRYFDNRFQQEMLVRALVEEKPRARVAITVYITSKIGKYMGGV